MKLSGGIKLVVLLIGITATTLFIADKADASTCTNVSSFGSVALDVPRLPNDGNVRMWVRMQAEKPNSKVLVEVNQSNCLEVSGTKLSNTAWSWQPYKSLADQKTINFGNISGNKIKIIGVEDGVRVDKVIFTSKDCVPQDFGENCLNVAVAEQTKIDDDAVVNLPPPSDKPISGDVVLTSTPNEFSTQIKSVQYVVEGRVVQTSNAPEPFDSTRVDNGKHTVLIETTLVNDREIRESTVVEVKNTLNPLSPIIRWAKINSNTVKLVSIIIAGVLIFVILFSSLRHYTIKRRQRKFHGF